MLAKTNVLSSWMKAASVETKQIGWDLALFLALVAAFFFWSVSRGKKKLVIAIVAIYILTALFPFVPLIREPMARTSVQSLPNPPLHLESIASS